MHICFLCDEYPPGLHGGIGSFTQTLGRALVADGHRVSVVGVYKGDKRTENDQGVSVVRLPESSIPHSGFVVNGLHLRQVLNQLHEVHPIDILDGPELSLSLVSSISPARKVLRMQGGHHFFALTLGKTPRPWRSWLERRSFSRADNFCAVSKFVADTTRTYLKLGAVPIEILPNPIDVKLFQPNPSIVESEGLILFAGTVVEKKGVRQLIEAMSIIVKEVPYAKLMIVGRDWIDPRTGKSFTTELKSRVPSGLATHIEFKGRMEHDLLPMILAQAQVCAFPSQMESQGIVVNEGMAMAKVVVASQTGPGPEIIEDGYSGLLCDPFDPNSIADAIVRALKDGDLRNRLGHNARQKAVENFSINVLVKKNEQFYEDILSPNS